MHYINSTGSASLALLVAFGHPIGAFVVLHHNVMIAILTYLITLTNIMLHE